MLVVVEDASSASSVAATLEGADREIVGVRSGADAVRACAERDVAVCVVADDLEAAAAIGAHPHARDVPIVLVTSRELDPAYIELAHARGVADVIQRSVAVPILHARISALANFQRHRIRDAARREAELAALQAQFLATLGHELRPPLNAIVGWARMLRDGSVRESQRARALQNVERSAEAQLELIEEMIDISRMTTGTLTLDLVVVDVRQIVEQVVEVLRPTAVEKQLTLFAAVDDDVAPMFADAERWRQIVQRLIKNAVMSTPTEGVVTVSLRNVESRVELAITDTGASNEPSLAARVFDGFAIVRHIVELHDGTIAIENNASGVGRRFVVTLPAAGRPPRTDDEAR